MVKELSRVYHRVFASSVSHTDLEIPKDSASISYRSGRRNANADVDATYATAEVAEVAVAEVAEVVAACRASRRPSLARSQMRLSMSEAANSCRLRR